MISLQRCGGTYFHMLKLAASAIAMVLSEPERYVQL